MLQLLQNLGLVALFGVVGGIGMAIGAGFIVWLLRRWL